MEENLTASRENAIMQAMTTSKMPTLRGVRSSALSIRTPAKKDEVDDTDLNA